jgi:hypothetical protein
MQGKLVTLHGVSELRERHRPWPPAARRGPFGTKSPKVRRLCVGPEPDQIQELMSGRADTPVVMVSLLRFKGRADTPGKDGSREEAYRRYAERARHPPQPPGDLPVELNRGSRRSAHAGEVDSHRIRLVIVSGRGGLCPGDRSARGGADLPGAHLPLPSGRHGHWPRDARPSVPMGLDLHVRSELSDLPRLPRSGLHPRRNSGPLRRSGLAVRGRWALGRRLW